MPLVTPDEVAQITGLKKFGLRFLAKPLMRFIHMTAINDVYDHCKSKIGTKFIDCILHQLNVKFEYFDEELKDRIPKEGPFVIVANHPLGTMDGMILIKLVSEVRPDFKVMANFLLQKIEPVSHYFFAVNPFAKHKDKKSSVSGMKESMTWVKDGHGMGIFPSGQVATYQWKQNKITEKEWEDSAIRLIKKWGCP